MKTVRIEATISNDAAKWVEAYLQWLREMLDYSGEAATAITGGSGSGFGSDLETMFSRIVRVSNPRIEVLEDAAT